eukprot:7530037-Pyramimonas_sp.AAC.1
MPVLAASSDWSAVRICPCLLRRIGDWPAHLFRFRNAVRRNSPFGSHARPLSPTLLTRPPK